MTLELLKEKASKYHEDAKEEEVNFVFNELFKASSIGRNFIIVPKLRKDTVKECFNNGFYVSDFLLFWSKISF